MWSNWEIFRNVNFFLNIHGYYFLLGVHLYFFVFCNGNLIMPMFMPGYIPSDKCKAIETYFRNANFFSQYLMLQSYYNYFGNLIMPMFMPGYIPSDKCKAIETYKEMSIFANKKSLTSMVTITMKVKEISAMQLIVFFYNDTLNNHYILWDGRWTSNWLKDVINDFD